MDRFTRCGLGILFLLSLPAAATEILSERPLLSFHTQPIQPKVGERLSVFAQVETDFNKNEVVLGGVLGSSPARMDKISEGLWAAGFDPFTEIKSHELLVSIYLRDKRQADRIRSAMGELRRQITVLEQKIAVETNLEKKAALEAQKNQKTAYRDELELSLERLKVFLKSETYSFSVAANPANSNYPNLTSVSPNAIPLDKRVRLTLTGANFPNTPHVKVGGENASIVSNNATVIEVLGPRLETEGPKTIEITFPAQSGEPKKNTILTNSIFVTNHTILENLRPVAVTDGYVRAQWPNPGVVTLDGSNSYDENGHNFEYEWIVKNSPANSVIFPGTQLANSPNPTFTPDKIGTFRIQLRLHEVGTEELLNSRVSTVTVEVK